jgi:tRNA pseudouridine55 synthase
MLLTRSNISDFPQWLEMANSVGASALIDKDSGWTSFDVIAKLRNTLKIKKVGHAGTLDPLATGLLIICFGKFTKKIEEYQALKKAYTAEIRLGAVTKSYDSEFEEENIVDIGGLTNDSIYQAAKRLTGEIMQTPPVFSAKKVKGKPLYSYARKDIEVTPKEAMVNVYRFDIKNVELPLVTAEIECSKGTYIRSLARDLGLALGCGGYLKSLRRTAIGEYSVDNALNLNIIVDLIKTNQ